MQYVRCERLYFHRNGKEWVKIVTLQYEHLQVLDSEGSHIFVKHFQNHLNYMCCIK